MGIVERYLLQLKNEKRRWRRSAVILAALSLVVMVGVSWNLRITGVAMANGANCGLEEHKHTEECYQSAETCTYEEHIHSISCYSDDTADIETSSDWEKTLPDLTGIWAEDIVLVAQSQLGTGESEKNYVVADDGETRNGITRYGQWYGNPYGEWSAMFAMFCLNYTGIPEELVPWSPGADMMMRLAQDEEILIEPDENVGAVGNLLFMNTDDDSNADNVLIVVGSVDGEITAIGGDLDDTVKEITISEKDTDILGYISIQQVQPELSMSAGTFRVQKDDKTYTIDVYALPVDSKGNRITDFPVTDLGEFSVTYSNRVNGVTVEDKFDSDLGAYQSAYFGTLNTVSVDNIASVWCSRYYDWGNKYALAYRQTNGSENTKWLTSTNSDTSLYLRYIPEYTVKFVSEGNSLSEKVGYNGYPTLTEPNEWEREGYTLLGWTINGNEQNVYTYEELLQMPITENVTYTAKWVQDITISFELGEYKDQLYSVDSIETHYGASISPLPTPAWKNNAVAMAFDGWYVNEELTEKVTAEYKFYADTILYAKWMPKEEGYFLYFMDFAREGQTPLVLMTYSVTEGQTASPYVPGNAPEGTDWDGKWYLEYTCQNEYNFSIPVSQMTDHLTGASGRDLYVYPGTVDVCRAIFVTYGTKVDPITTIPGTTIDLSKYVPERTGYEFKNWTLKDGTVVSNQYELNETTTFYAQWEPGYVPFEAILRIENANDTNMTQAEILGTWYAKAGSQIRVKSTYKGSGNSRTGTHEVVCVVDGTEYPVYKNSGLTEKATLSDVYAKYFVYNNTGTTWTDEVNWDDVFIGGEVPYSTRPISSAGDTIINFDYMRVRNDIVFTISNASDGAYLDIYKLQKNGLITGSVTYTGTKPTREGSNVSAKGISAQNITWSYTAGSRIGDNYNNYYTLHDMKYGQRIYEVYPVGGSWLTIRDESFHWYKSGSGALFSSRREDLSSDFFSSSGRALTPYSLTAVFSDEDKIGLMYAIECLEGETADFTINGVGYKVQTQLCEVVNHTGDFSQKDLLGCGKEGSASYTNLNTTNSTLGGTSVRTLFGTKYWDYYKIYDGVSSLSDIDKAYIFYYTRIYMDLEFSFAYDSNGDGVNETVKYEDIAYGEKIDEYQFGKPDYEYHNLLNREGYEFVGWLDANGFVLEAEDWNSMIAVGDSEDNAMIFIAKWEKISNNIVEYYEDRSSPEPFESHYFEDGELVQYPTMTVYPQGWVWQEYGEGLFQRFDWDVPMYGEYGVQETRVINGEEVVVNVIRIYGTWDESHTKVIYDPNPPQGGVPGSEPTDPNEYTIWQSSVPVASRGDTANEDPEMIFVGWKLDRNGVVYQPGDHVQVQWPRTMVFTAQWTKTENVVYLRYDPNGGTPEEIYPNDKGYPYEKNATASVWDNKLISDSQYFTRTGYEFIGWNTEPDGTGTSYAPDSTIVLKEPVTTLYAQWQANLHTLTLYKVDAADNNPLDGAKFGLYKQENDMFLTVDSLTTGIDGSIIFNDLESDTLYKLVEEKAPDGYAIIAKETFFKLNPYGDTISLVFCDSEGNITSAPNGITGEYHTGNNFLTITAQNISGYELPATGGMGIYLYLLCGLILTFAPLVYGLSLRRKHERRSEH
ncbi:MAG: InlB B-repeat-containing protein [Parabacteroides sp.]|nr:InlB B-repeat-containing protein [Parabacteroides sp.]